MWNWLEMGDLEKETEGLVTAEGQDISPLCKMCSIKVKQCSI